MSLLIAGSIATDHLMTFRGRFADQLVADQLHTVSLSFLVDNLDVRRGGVGANIASRVGSTTTVVPSACHDSASAAANVSGVAARAVHGECSGALDRGSGSFSRVWETVAGEEALYKRGDE